MSTGYREERRADRRLDAEERRKDRALDREERRKDEAAAERARAKEQADKLRAQKERRQRRAATRKRIVDAVTEHMPIPGIPVVGVSMVMAWGGQYDAAHAAGFGDYAVGVPLLLEGLTLTLMTLTSAAMTAKKPYAALMGWTWAVAFLAAGINGYGHILEGGDSAVLKAAVFGIASLVGVFLWWRVAQSRAVTRTKAERAEDRARAQQRRKRRRKFKPVAQRADEILAAHPFGTITEEQAWETAWLDVHAMPVARTADVVATFQDAEAVAESLSAVALRRDFRAGVDDWLEELLDEGPGGSARTAPRKPSGGPSQGATTLGGIGKRAFGRKPRTDSVEPLADDDVKAARKLRDAAPEQFSTPAVAKLLGRSKAYAKRVRDAVNEETER